LGVLLLPFLPWFWGNVLKLCAAGQSFCSGNAYDFFSHLPHATSPSTHKDLYLNMPRAVLKIRVCQEKREYEHLEKWEDESSLKIQS